MGGRYIKESFQFIVGKFDGEIITENIFDSKFNTFF